MIKRPTPENRKRARKLLVTVVLIGILAVIAFVTFCLAFSRLHDLWIEQARVTDHELDVVIATGKTIQADIITYYFGLTNGANLATIPFAERRVQLLKREPKIREIKIERRLPNRVIIDVSEREPVVCLVKNQKAPRSGRVADSEGVIFEQHTDDTATLPILIVSGDAPLTKGQRLTGPAAAGLRLLDAATLPELATLHVLAVDASQAEHLTITLGDYSQARIAWDHMLENTAFARESLIRQLRHLNDVIASQVAPGVHQWDVTDFGKPGRIYMLNSNRVVR